MSDSEDDYMSDKYLTKDNDVRPSLIQDRSQKRKFEMAVKKREDIKRQRTQELERKGILNNDILQKSLQKPIEANNKGFQLLAKMGFKPGQALGKKGDHENNSHALTAPIGITIKANRGGLGREAALKELAQRRQELLEQRLRNQIGESLTTEEFRKRSIQKADTRYAQRALRKCQQTCETLDIESDVELPEMPWFWPERLVQSNDEMADNELKAEDEINEKADEYSDAEKLEMLTNYLRTSYNFCFWCGVKYKNEQDLIENCPGSTRDEH